VDKERRHTDDRSGRENLQWVDHTDEDFRAALRDLRTYVDISIDDVKRICSLAIKHARERIARSVPVSDVMTRKVVVVSKNADLHEVSRILSENRISGAPVVDSESRVIGVITEADVLAMTGIGRGHSVKDLIRHLLGEPLPRREEGGRVENFMSSPAITTTPNADIREAAAILDERNIKRLPVLDDGERLVGIVSRADIVKATGTK
jgi:CBS-domain-containing membrane protein